MKRIVTIVPPSSLETTMRSRASNVLLVIAIMSVAINFGGTYYQMTVLYPEWSGNLPQSLTTFFADGRWFVAQTRFWQNPATDIGLPAFLIALILSWPYRRRRNWMLVALLILVPIVVATGLWFIPGVLRLMRDGGVGLSPDEITRSAQAWLFWDKFRFAGVVLVFLALLFAFASPAERPLKEVA